MLTRQQRRSAERRAEQLQEHNDMVSSMVGDLTVFGAYYKGDTPDGFGLSFCKAASPGINMDHVRHWSHIISNNTQQLLKKIDECNDRFVDPKQNFIDIYWDRLKQHIREFNIDTYGQLKQPISDKPIGTITNQLALAVFADIHFLQEMGEISADDQNGMHYGYEIANQ
jgi:hypothetical protein